MRRLASQSASRNIHRAELWTAAAPCYLPRKNSKMKKQNQRIPCDSKGFTHLERCSQELDQFTKFHSSDYISGAVDLDLQNRKAMESAATVWLNMGETGEVKCRYVPKAPLGNITSQWKGLRWAMPSKVFIAPLQHLLFFLLSLFSWLWKIKRTEALENRWCREPISALQRITSY